MKIISVSQVTSYIKEKIENDYFLSNLWVKGEVSNFKHHSSGHMYFTLKDRSSAIRCIMFRSHNHSLAFTPKDGMAVIARGYISLYERDGQYQLYVQEMHQQGIGALYTAFLQLKEQLEKEGFFDQGRKKELPAFPRKIAVITSPTGAAVRDIITVMTRRYPQVHIVLIPVAVQGEEAPPQIANGIRLANTMEGLDVIIVGRGGGSIEELWAFNTEEVARSIFHSQIPVVSAVGHETDFTIADFVADRRAPTPSAAAELVVPDCIELRKQLANLSRRLVLGVKNNMAVWRERCSRACDSPVLQKPKDRLYRKMQDLDHLTKNLVQSMTACLNDKQNTFALQISRLNDLSPIATIQRGYSICRDNKGHVVKKVRALAPGDNIEIIISDGSVDCLVETIREGVYGQEKE